MSSANDLDGLVETPRCILVGVMPKNARDHLKPKYGTDFRRFHASLVGPHLELAPAVSVPTSDTLFGRRLQGLEVLSTKKTYVTLYSVSSPPFRKRTNSTLTQPPVTRIDKQACVHGTRRQLALLATSTNLRKHYWSEQISPSVHGCSRSSCHQPSYQHTQFQCRDSTQEHVR